MDAPNNPDGSPGVPEDSLGKRKKMSMAMKEVLIKTMRKYPALWDPKDADYKKSTVKASNWNAIVCKLRETFPDELLQVFEMASTDQLKSKWHNMRSVYNRCKRITAKTKNSTVSWPLYQLMDSLVNKSFSSEEANQPVNLPKGPITVDSKESVFVVTTDASGEIVIQSPQEISGREGLNGASSSDLGRTAEELIASITHPVSAAKASSGVKRRILDGETQNSGEKRLRATGRSFGVADELPPECAVMGEYIALQLQKLSPRKRARVFLKVVRLLDAEIYASEVGEDLQENS